MTGDEAVLLIEQLLSQGGRVKKNNSVLTPLEKTIILGHWKGERYWKIAEESGNDETYVKQVGSKLWAALSEATGEKVTKPNLKVVLLGQVAHSLASSVSPVQPLPVVLGDYLPLPPQVFGREEDLRDLQKAFQPSVTGGLRCVFLTGALGVGKTTVAAKFAATTTQFDRVVWISLHDQTPLQILLTRLLHHLDAQVESIDRQVLMDQLLLLLQSSRCLIVINGYERVLDVDKYEGFLSQVVEARHQSCFLLVSDQHSPMIEDWQQIGLSIQISSVKPLSESSSHSLLLAHKITNEADRNLLIQLYKGNPFLLVTAAKTIGALFGGNAIEFAKVTTTLYTAGIRGLLEPQFERLSPLQKGVLDCLSQVPTMTPLQLREEVNRSFRSSESLIEAIETLRHRGLIEISQVGEGSQQQTIYFLQPMVRKHVLTLSQVSN